LTRNPLIRATGPASVDGLWLVGVGIVASAALIAFAFINAPAVEKRSLCSGAAHADGTVGAA
jgi:hypothetical protein